MSSVSQPPIFSIPPRGYHRVAWFHQLWEAISIDAQRMMYEVDERPEYQADLLDGYRSYLVEGISLALDEADRRAAR